MNCDATVKIRSQLNVLDRLQASFGKGGGGSDRQCSERGLEDNAIVL